MLEINVNFDSSVTNLETTNPTLYNEFTTGVDDAVQQLESLFSTPITVTIDVGYGEIAGQSLGSGALGESEGDEVTASYAAVRSALIAENAPGSSTLPATSPDQGTLVLSTAQAKALGLEANNGSLDGYVGFSSSLPFSYANGVTPPSNEYDFMGTVEHEMTEVMGRISLVNDQPNYYSLMDLYRYTSSGTRDLAAGHGSSTAYFSINNGAANLGTWNNVASNGDLGDWYPTGPAPNGDDAFNDYSDAGVINEISPDDVTLMEAIGFEGATGGAQPTPPFTGVPEILWYDPTILDVGYNDGPNTTWHDLGAVPPGYTVAGVGDFTGAGTTDILWFDPSTADVGYNDGPNTTWHDLGAVPSGYTVAGIGDFNGDGKSDILWFDAGTGDVGYNDGPNTTWHDLGAVPPGYTVAGVGDLSGSGTTDILWFDAGTGDVGYNDGPNTTWHDLGAVPSGYTAAGVGDFGGNGMTDILWFDPSTGDVGYNQGPNTPWHDLGAVPPGYAVAGVGDFSGSGTTDILWFNASTGDVGYNAGPNTAWHDLGVAPAGYHVAAA